MSALSGEALRRWTEAVAAAGVVYDGPPALVEVRVAGGPDGVVTWHARLVPGAPPSYEPGAASDAGASYEQAWEDALAQLEGRFDPAVAFMQGNLKVKGATRPLYELFQLWADPAHRRATAAAWAAGG